MRRTIEQLEAKRGIRVPIDYATFLKVHTNPYSLAGDIAAVPTSLHYLLVLSDEEFSYSLIDVCEMFESRMPSSVIPIGSDDLGNKFCLGLVGTPYESKVYFWDHELEAGDDEVPTFDNMTLVANSFTEFIANFKKRPA